MSATKPSREPGVGFEIDLRLDHPGWARELSRPETLIQRAADALAEEIGLGGQARLVDLLLTSDAEVQALNHDWRGKDTPTDVLSFPASQADAPFIGDIALAFETVARDAESLRRCIRNHFSHLLIHGLLHLLGHDHVDEAEAEEMENLERKALARIGIPDPYTAGEPHTGQATR